MIPLEKFKSLLGPEGQKMSEEEILKLREFQQQLARLLFDSWVETLERKHRLRSGNDTLPTSRI